MIRNPLALIATLVAVMGVWLGVAGPAAAEWRRAESPRFIVYSTGGERDLRDYVQRLETYDWLLRARFGLPEGELPTRKLPIYLVSDRNQMQQVSPNASAMVAGTYFSTEEDIFAVAYRDADEDDYLLHEYVHHFFFQNNFATGYPAWLVEGLAEYFMTADIGEGSVEVGRASPGRVQALTTNSWTPIPELLTLRYDQVRGAGPRATYYPLSWLLTHWFLSDDARRRQLQVYLADVARGIEPVTAFQSATGLTLEQFRNALRVHLTQGLPFTRYRADFPRPEVTVTTLPRSADELLLLGQRLKVGVEADQRAATAALIRSVAARYPDDPFARLQLGHAEIHYGDPAEGERILATLLETDPTQVEALQLLATRRMAQAEEEGADATARIAEARAFLARAFAADRSNYETLMLLARTRTEAANYPNPNDLQTWAYAFEYAPQLPGIRLGYGRALMLAHKPDEAIFVLQPLANAPHGGRSVETARTLIQQARAGQAPQTDTSTDEDDAGEETGPDAPPA